MSERMDVVAWKQTKNGKWFAVRLGSAAQNKKGGWDLYLDAIPAPVDGQYRMSLAEQRQREGGKPSGGDDLDDKIPF